MSCCGICGRSEFHLLPPVPRPPSHSPPLFPVGWVVSLQPFISIHKEPNIAPFFTSFSPPVVSSEIVPSWEVVTWFHFCKPKSYCCPVSRSVCSHSQAGGKVVPHTEQKLQKSGPRNPRDDSPLPALLSRWHVFPRPAVIFGFLRQHYQIFTLNR